MKIGQSPTSSVVTYSGACLLGERFGPLRYSVWTIDTHFAKSVPPHRQTRMYYLLRQELLGAYFWWGASWKTENCDRLSTCLWKYFRRAAFDFIYFNARLFSIFSQEPLTSFIFDAWSRLPSFFICSLRAHIRRSTSREYPRSNKSFWITRCYRFNLNHSSSGSLNPAFPNKFMTRTPARFLESPQENCVWK